MGVIRCEILKPWDTIHVRESVIDLEGLTGIDLKVMLLMKYYNLQGNMNSDLIHAEEPEKNLTLTSILKCIRILPNRVIYFWERVILGNV